MATIGISGLTRHGFPSINRTGAFYRSALEGLGAVVEIDADATGPIDEAVDAVVSFGGPRFWKPESRPDCPVLFAMHGGPVLDPHIRNAIPHVTTADAFIGNCSSDAAIMRDWFDGPGVRIETLPLPVDPERFRPVDTLVARRRLGLPEDRLIVGFVSRFVAQKNLHQFFAVLSEVRRRLPEAPVIGLVVGSFWRDYPVLPLSDEPYDAYCRRRLADADLDDAIVFNEAVTNDRALTHLYAACDVMLHPTSAIDENFGYTPIEAAACGTPTIGTAYGGLKDSIVDGTTGVQLPTWCTDGGVRFDIGQAADEVAALLTDSERRSQYRSAAIEHAFTTYDVDRCADILRRAVVGAIDAWPTAEPVQPRPFTPRPHEGVLPVADPPFAFYRESIERYVSDPVPMVGPDDDVRHFGPLQCQGAGIVRLDDAAWPATHDLSDRPPLPPLHRSAGRVRDFLDIGWTLDDVQSLVETGLLTTPIRRGGDDVTRAERHRL